MICRDVVKILKRFRMEDYDDIEKERKVAVEIRRPPRMLSSFPK